YDRLFSSPFFPAVSPPRRCERYRPGNTIHPPLPGYLPPFAPRKPPQSKTRNSRRSLPAGLTKVPCFFRCQLGRGHFLHLSYDQNPLQLFYVLPESLFFKYSKMLTLASNKAKL